MALNSLAPGKFKWNFRHVIFKQILVIDGWGISCEIALVWMSLDFADDQWTLPVQVMAWCRQATSHYLSQCWPRSLSPYGVTRPQWVLTHLLFDKMAAISQTTFFRCIFMNEKSCILIQISLRFVQKGLIDNKSTLVQVMAWRRTGAEPFPEPMLPSSLTHICGTRGRRVKLKNLAYLKHSFASNVDLWERTTC